MNAVDGDVQPCTSSTVVFETARLVVRRIEHADAAAMQTVYGDAEAMRWVGNGKPLDRPQCENWIAITHRNYAVRGYGMFAINERASSKVIGFCGLVHPGGQVEAEIKYALGREYWGQGFATEAAGRLLVYGAATHSLVSVIATAAPDNTASHRVLLKAGMKKGPLRPNEDDSFTQLFVWFAGNQSPAQ